MIPDTLRFEGPFPLLTNSTDVWPHASQCNRGGIYLFTVPVAEKYRILYAGISQKSMAGRLGEHLSMYLSGRYKLYDATQLIEGNREQNWEPNSGNYWNTILKLDEHREKLSAMLSVIQIFYAPTDCDLQALKRIESAIIKSVRSIPEAEKFMENYSPSIHWKKEFKAVQLLPLSTFFGLPEEIQV